MLEVACEFILDCPYCYSNKADDKSLKEGKECDECIESEEWDNREKEKQCWINYFKNKVNTEIEENNGKNY